MQYFSVNYSLYMKRYGTITSLAGIKVLVILALLGAVGSVAAQGKYEVVSNSGLNVRSKPSIGAAIIGTLNPHDQIEVYSILDSWAVIAYKNSTAYVYAKYIRKIEEAVEKVADDAFAGESDVARAPAKVENRAAGEAASGKSGERSRAGFAGIGIDFVPSVFMGFANFVSDGVSPKGTAGFGVDFAFQFTARNTISYIPRNYYMEASLGYSQKGSGAFPLHYMALKLSPVGYKYPMDGFMLFGKLGIYTGYTFSTIETRSYVFDSKVDVGLLVEIGAEYEKIGVGLSYERGLTNVCNSKLKLNNQCFYFNLSYRLFNIN